MAQRKVSLKIYGYQDDSWKFNLLHVLGESIALAGTHWKALAWWAVLPFALQLACTVYTPPSSKEEGQGYILLAVLLLLVLMGIAAMLFSIRTYRLVLCDDTQPAPYWKQLFQRRTWTYIKCGLKIILASLAYSPVPILAGYFGGSVLGGLKESLAGVIPVSLFWPLVMFVASVPLWIFLGPMLMLLFPDAAADGKGVFSEMDDMGSPARWRIVGIMFCMWLPSIVVGVGQIALATQLAALPVLAGVAVLVLAQGVTFYASVIGSIAGALVYQRLKAGWQVVNTVTSVLSDSKL